MPFHGAAYCVSDGQPTLLLVVHQDSQVICCAVHKYSHLIQNFNPSLAAMIQLKPGIPPASLNGPHKSSLRRRNTADKKKKSGLHFERVFSDAAVAPFDQIEWERRTAEITDDSGKVIFKQEDIEVPKSWSALATKIAVSKYFYGDIANGTDPHKGGRETSVRQLIHRVTRTIADWGMADGYFAEAKTAEIFYDELTWLCVNQYGAFNSPVWFNVGFIINTASGKDAGAGQLFLQSRDRRGRARRDAVRISAGQRLLHPVGRGHDGRHHAPGRSARRCSSSMAAAPAPIFRHSLEHKRKTERRRASRAARSRS